MCPILSYQNIATLTPVYTGCIFQLNDKIRIKKNRNLIKNKKFLLQYYELILCFSKIFMQAS